MRCDRYASWRYTTLPLFLVTIKEGVKIGVDQERPSGNPGDGAGSSAIQGMDG